MDLWFVVIDSDDVPEATLVVDLTEGDYGAGDYIFVKAETAEDAVVVARTMLG
jgi:hypothetical protein